MKKQLSRVLVYDIESSPALGLFFGKPYDVNIAKIVQHEYIFGFAYKWLDENKVHTCYIWDFPLYKSDPKNSIEVIKKWAELVMEADILVGHNSDSFDYKQMFGRLPQYNLPPVPKPQMVDTKKAAKQIGYYPSNKLDDLGERFGIGRKLEHKGYTHAIDLWWDCMNDEPKAKKHMVAYNKIDVVRTEALYLKFLPYMTNHPNRANLAERPDVCPKCESDGPFQSSGWRFTKTGKYRRFQCMNCASYLSTRTQVKGKGPTYV